MLTMAPDKIHIMSVSGSRLFWSNSTARWWLLPCRTFWHWNIQKTRARTMVQNNRWTFLGPLMVLLWSLRIEASLDEKNKINSWKRRGVDGLPIALAPIRCWDGNWPARYLETSFSKWSRRGIWGRTCNAESYTTTFPKYETECPLLNKGPFRGLSLRKAVAILYQYLCRRILMVTLAEKREQDPLDFRLKSFGGTERAHCGFWKWKNY